MKRQSFPRSPSLDRRVGHVKPTSLIAAFCEGKTEKLYLDAFASFVGRRLVKIEIVKQVGVPSTVIERCVEKKAELESIASKRGADSFDKNFSVWAVFDRDDHKCYYSAIKKARRRVSTLHTQILVLNCGHFSIWRHMELARLAGKKYKES